MYEWVSVCGIYTCMWVPKEARRGHSPQMLRTKLQSSARAPCVNKHGTSSPCLVITDIFTWMLLCISLGFFFCLRCFCNMFLKIEISNHCYYEGVLYTNNSSSLPWTQVNTEQWCQLPLFPSLLAPASFPSLTVYSRDSHPKLHGNGGSGNLCFSPKLRRKTVSISYSGWCLMHLDTLAKGKLRS